MKQLMKTWTSACLFVLCAILAHAQEATLPFIKEQQTGYTGTPIPGLTYLEDGFTFLALGDFGRVGNYFQKDVAREMGHAMVGLDAEFIVSVGDNFYPNGVASIRDYHWQSSFEEIYTDPSLYADWYTSLGNHDYRGNVQAQIDYTGISRRWQMPDRYYSKTFELENGEKLLLVVMDTNPYIDDYHDEPEKYGDIAAQDTAAQTQWLMRELRNDNPAIAWKIVVGHHPLYSGGKRKDDANTLLFERKFAGLFDELGVDAYICGHEHDLQIIKPEGRHTVQFLSGAASEVCESGERAGTIFAAAEPGFMAFSIRENSMLVQTIGVSAERASILHSYELIK